MKIIKITSFLVKIPYKIKYKTATNTTQFGKHVVVKIETDDNIYGWGEGGIISLLHPNEGDNPESMMAVINTYLAPAILGLDPTNISCIIEKMEKTIRGNYFAKCALDHAIYDIAGKAWGVSAAKILGGAYHNSFFVSRSLPLSDPKSIAKKAKELKDQGYKTLTIKGGINYKHDIEAIKLTRQAVGDDLKLEIDPNGGYDRITALRAILAMEEYGLEAVEQPIEGSDIEGLAELRKRITTPIIVDESVCNIEDIKKVIHGKAADIICLKPFKSGGLFITKKMQVISEAFGIPVSTGSIHPFGIGTCALHQFIATISNVSTTGYGCPTERFVDDIVDETCFTFKDGQVKIHEKPGLGVEVNEKKLSKYTIKSKSVSI